MKRTLILGLGIVALVGGGFGLWALLKPSSPAEPQLVSIAFTADTNGRIEPCGCFTGQLGGITRVRSYRRAKEAHQLLYEVGDAIAGSEDYHVHHYDYLLKAFSDAGYTAVNLGHRETKLSAEDLREAAAASPVPLVSASVVDEAGEPIVQPFVISELATVDEEGNETGTMKVATIGVVDSRGLVGSPGEGVRIARMDEVLRRHLPEMKKDADLLVCLAFTDDSGLRDLANEFYEISFFLGGDVPQPSQKIEQVNQSWLLSTTNQSRALAQIEAIWNPGTRSIENVAGTVALMTEDIPQDPEVREHSKAYREDIRHIQLAIDSPDEDTGSRVPGVAPSAFYVGSESCAGCHQEDYKIWKESGHAHAFSSLVRTRSDGDPSCIQCHTVGFGEPSGYLRAMGGKRMVNVGCESCHGPGSEHIRLRSLAGPGEAIALALRPVGPGQCVQCHHGEFSRPFSWDEFWPHIKHGGSKKTSSEEP